MTEDEAYKAAGHAPRRRAACGRWFLTLDARHEVKHGEPGEVRILRDLDDAFGVTTMNLFGPLRSAMKLLSPCTFLDDCTTRL